MPAKSSAPKKISLALQGGGTHGAFSWGVLDRLLMHEQIDIEAISATSGGAISAAIVAQGLRSDGKEGAREKLAQFWRKVSIASNLMPLRMKVVDKFLGHAGIDFAPSTLALDYITRIFSPYQFNLFDINPMRGIVEEMVDFAALNNKSPIALYINATHVRTGKSRVFDHTQLSLEAVMASCCLPYVFKTVEIEGEPYWDGSFSGCPSLAPLVNNSTFPDILLVQSHPSFVEEVPTTAADILDRATEISFHSILLHELKTIDIYNKSIETGKLDQKPVFIHRIEAQELLSSLGRSSKLNADWEFLRYLHDLGMQAATDWLEANWDAIGKKSSVDLSAMLS